MSVDVVQYATGTVDGATSAVTVSLPNTTQGGTTVIIVAVAGVNADSGGTAFDTASGGAGSFFFLRGNGGGPRANFDTFYKENVAAGEQSYSVSVTGTVVGCWIIMEVAGLEVTVAAQQPWTSSTPFTPVNPSTAGLVASTTTRAVPATAGTTTFAYTAAGIAVFCAATASTTAPVISGYSGNLQEIAQVSVVSVGGFSIAVAVAIEQLSDIGQFTRSASVTPNAYMTSDLTIYAAAGSNYAHIYDIMTGAEQGTASGITSGSLVAAGTGPFDASAGSPEVVSTVKRSGLYSYKLSSSAAAEWLAWNDPGRLGYYKPNVASGANYYLNPRVNFSFDGTLPSGDLELMSIEAGSAANGVVVRYVSASQKIGVKVGTGTEVLSDATVSATGWFAVELRYASFLTTHTCEWYMDYDSLDTTAGLVAQTAATNTGMTGALPTSVVLGWKAARTGTVYIDDVIVSKQYFTFPLGDVRIEAVGVDPTGTPTISGTTANFQVMTSGGTGTAWNAANAVAALDDIPPVFGATADGIMQITAAASDYVDIPMATLDLSAADKALRAVGWLVPIWAASGTAATLGIKTNDGTNDLFVVAAADHGQDASAAIWLCGMQRYVIVGSATATVWPISKTLLDALSLRFGFSTDATPDVGILSVIAEVAWSPALESVTVDAEDGLYRAYSYRDANTGATLGFRVTTPNNGRGATFFWSAGGVDNSHYVAANSTWPLALNHSTTAEFGGAGLSPDPQPE